ncbi:alpha mannosidase-like protein [Entophlyctis sp. JEL0112]|nr:alpha mannosidase-like protein [Entophlyctis sp. JEL0112]
MSLSRREQYRVRARGMFDHAFGGYLNYAFPLDELDPVRCIGRGPDRTNPDNWNINDVLGNFSTTLVDSLDAVYTVQGREAFERAVRLTLKYVSFDQDVRVQVFETNIRMLGGLISAHNLASGEAAGSRARLNWYQGELLVLAVDLADRLLPAFDTPTGLPTPRVNLRKGVLRNEVRDTCTAGAGSLLLEFGTLSRLTGNPTYEIVARRAFKFLWSRRSNLGLLGNTIDIDSGNWIHQLSGIGAGADSFYEYALKAFVLFGDPEYLQIFSEAYSAINIYNRDLNGLIFKNVDMNSGQTSTVWIDSLSAFWPGLQVLAGDIQAAEIAHFTYWMLWRRFQGLPERFDFINGNLNIANYPLRPELIESTYFLFMATKNPYYLEVGAIILEDLDRKTRTSCGFASMQSVDSGILDGRMESFVLSETLKYLYLLFDEGKKVSFHSQLNLVQTMSSTQTHQGQTGKRKPIKKEENLAGNPKLSMTCPNQTLDWDTEFRTQFCAPTVREPATVALRAGAMAIARVRKETGLSPAETCAGPALPSPLGSDNLAAIQEAAPSQTIMVLAPADHPNAKLVPIISQNEHGYEISTLNNVRLTLKFDSSSSGLVVSKVEVDKKSYALDKVPTSILRVPIPGISFLVPEPNRFTQSFFLREIESAEGGSNSDIPLKLHASAIRQNFAAGSYSLRESAVINMECMIDENCADSFVIVPVNSFGEQDHCDSFAQRVGLAADSGALGVIAVVDSTNMQTDVEVGNRKDDASGPDEERVIVLAVDSDVWQGKAAAASAGSVRVVVGEVQRADVRLHVGGVVIANVQLVD